VLGPLIQERERKMKTYMQRKEDVSRNWYVIDATDQPLGRLASKVATIIKGKHKVTKTPHVDGGDFVIVINARDVKLTGNKINTKMYYNHSGYPGGLRVRTAKTMKEQYPIEMMERAVKGMLPKGTLGRAMYKKLFVYEGEEHPHAAQMPVVLKMEEK